MFSMKRMNPEDQPCRAWFVWASAPPRDLDALHFVIPAVYGLLGVRPTRIAYTARTKIGHVYRSVYSVDRLKGLIESPDTNSLRVMARQDSPITEIVFHLRDIPGHEAHTTRRHAELYLGAPDRPGERGPREFLTAVVRAYPVVQGAALRMPTNWHASSEASLVLHSVISDDTERRLMFDSAHEREAMRLARRLYPVTIFGAELWAKLPPLPNVEPAPNVEDLGNCKLLTCWPELVDPHDLQFLLGTRELRRWLWPYTIQNPADDPDAVDSKLRWAGLLPWN